MNTKIKEFFKIKIVQLLLSVTISVPIVYYLIHASYVKVPANEQYLFVAFQILPYVFITRYTSKLVGLGCWLVIFISLFLVTPVITLFYAGLYLFAKIMVNLWKQYRTNQFVKY